MNALGLIEEIPLLLWWPAFVVFLRCGAAVALLPGFGAQAVPARIKLMLALALSAAVALTGPALPPIPENTGALVLICLSETCVGAALGFGVRLFILALQTAGTIAAQSTSLAQMSGGVIADPMPGLAQALSFSALVLLMISDFPMRAVIFLAGSYQAFPVGTFPDAGVLTTWGVARIGKSFALAFQLAAPFFVISLLYNITLGAINRAMPQLMVAFVGAPLITWGALAILFLAAPLILREWHGQLDGFLLNPGGGP